SYNSSWSPLERLQAHAGLLYQPFRLDRVYTDVEEVAPGSGVLGSTFHIRQRRTLQRDALGFTLRVEGQPTVAVDQAGLGYMYLGPVAGDKQEIDVDASRGFAGAFNVSLAYIYRQPVIGPAPLLFEGTVDNPGALITSPRGP